MTFPVGSVDPAAHGRTFVASVRPDMGLFRALCDDAEAYVAERGAGVRTQHVLRIVLEELLTNIAMHASARGDVGLRIETDAEAIRVRIDDDGVAFDPTTVAEPPITASLDTAQVGGLGLQMVRSSVRAFRYRRVADRNVLEAEVPIDAGVRAAP